MPEEYDPAATGNVIVQRCFEQHYLFFYADEPIGNYTELGAMIGRLVAGNVTEIRAGKFGAGQKLGYRVTIEVETECPDHDPINWPNDDGIKRTAGLWSNNDS